MHAHIHIPRTTGWAAGDATLDVTCEKCARSYRYRMVRRAQATVLGDGDAAASLARERARRRLDELLRDDHDPVACPACGWFQQGMIRHDRRARAVRLHLLQSVAWSCLFISGLMIGVEAADPTPGGVSPLKAKLTYGVGALGVVTMGAWLLLWTRRDLNVNPGMAARSHLALPVPWLTSGPGAAAAPPPRSALVSPAPTAGGWITVQALDVKFPPACARCLEPTDDRVAIPVFSYPYCAACAKRDAKRRLVVSAAIAVLVALVFVGPLVGGKRFDLSTSLLIPFGLVGGFLLGWFFVPSAQRPMKFRRFHVLRNVIDVRFKNAAYTAPFLAANAPRVPEPGVTARDASVRGT